MPSNTRWRDLRAKRVSTPEHDAEVRSGAQAIILQSRLNELRERCGVSQAQLAEELHVSQPNISRIEREDDIRLSTLARYVQALGGHVEIQAVFDSERVPLV